MLLLEVELYVLTFGLQDGWRRFILEVKGHDCKWLYCKCLMTNEAEFYGFLGYFFYPDSYFTDLEIFNILLIISLDHVLTGFASGSLLGDSWVVIIGLHE